VRHKLRPEAAQKTKLLRQGVFACARSWFAGVVSPRLKPIARSLRALLRGITIVLLAPRCVQFIRWHGYTGSV
jgi:hypothetical protein